MAYEVKIPKLGLTMEEGKIVEWKKAEGDWVEEGDVIYVIETEKITYEVEADISGFVVITAQPGEELPIGEIIGFLVPDKEEYAKVISGKKKENKTTADVEITETSVKKETLPIEPAPKTMSIVIRDPSTGKRLLATPVAKKLALEKGIDLLSIKGTGPGGAIRKADVMMAETMPKTSPAAIEVPEKMTGPKTIKEKVVLSGTRKVIAKRMHQSLQEMAQLTAFGSVDMTEIIKLRNNLLTFEDSLGVRITYTDIFTKLLSIILREMPIFNASIEDGHIVYWNEINIGIAVAVEDSLIVPVIHGTEDKSIFEIGKKRFEIVDKARSNALMPDDITGGTFTLTNFGSYGGETETAIINPPEAAIMGVGMIEKKAVVKEDEIMIRPMMKYSFTTDHRLIDGATSGKFRARFKELIEEPKLLWALLR